MRSLTDNQQIRYGAILSYLGIGAYILIGLLYTPWMIDIIGKDDYGLYTLAYSIISLFVFDFGLSAAVQRFVAKYLAEGTQERVNSCLSVVYKLYIYIDVLVLIVLSVIYIHIPDIYTELTVEQIERLKVVYVMAGLFSVISFPFIPLNGILSAYEKFVQLKACDLASKVLTVIVNIICLSYGGGLYELVITNVIIGLVIVLVKFIIVRKQTSVKVSLAYTDRQEMKSLFSFSGWTTIVSLCQRTIFNIAPSILGMFAAARVIAVFGISINLEAYTFTFASALNGLFLPRVSRILNVKGEVLPLMVRVGRFQILTLGLIMIGFAIVGRDFISCWLGSGYEDAYIYTLLFIIPAFLLLPADIADQALLASGKVKYRAYVYIIMAITNVVLSYFMTMYWGALGLSLSIFISYMIRNIIMYYIYQSKLQINILSFFKETYGKMSLGLLLSTIVSYFVCSFFVFDGWLSVLIRIVVITICYIVIMMRFALNTNEKNNIRGLIKNVCGQ